MIIVVMAVFRIQLYYSTQILFRIQRFIRQIDGKVKALSYGENHANN